METNDKKDRRDDIFSRSVRAGKRTYFFDVKATRADDYYLTITESTKRFNDDWSFYYEKNRLFLYNEDFDKYKECLDEVTKYIIDEKGAAPTRGNGGFKAGGATTPSETNHTTIPSAELTPVDAPDDTSPASEKTDEEVGVVEEAHEKAISEIGSEETETAITTPDTDTLAQTDETSTAVEAKIETKTE